MKKAGKLLSVILTILFFVPALSIICIAAEKQTAVNQRKSPADTQAFKPESIKITQSAVRKIPSAVKLNTAIAPSGPKVDLVCSIKAYYDQARTMPVTSLTAQTGIYHLTPAQSPQRPLPYHAYFTVEVKNTGWKSAAANVTNKVTLSGNALYSPGYYITSPAVTLEPGETAAFDYYVGPFYPYIGMKDKMVIVQAIADVGSKVSEDNEANNIALYRLTFVWP